VTDAVAEVKEKSPQEYFAELRHWILAHCHTGHPVRQSAYQMSLTAIVHRMMKIGPDESLNHLTSRDLLTMLLYTNGEVAEWLMRAAFTRALIEDDRDVYEHLAKLPFMPECTAWYWKIVAGLIGAAEDAQESTDWLHALPAEEKALARLLIARCFPDTAHIDWLHDIPEHCPAIAYHLARIIAQKKDYQHAVENWLRDRPLVRNQAYT
jgi:hypothetical protein